MNRDLRDYRDIAHFVRSVQVNKDALVALDESALSGDQERMTMVREAIDLLKRYGLPTS